MSSRDETSGIWAIRADFFSTAPRYHRQARKMNKISHGLAYVARELIPLRPVDHPARVRLKKPCRPNGQLPPLTDLSNYATEQAFFITGPTATQNSPFLPPAAAVVTVSTHCVCPERTTRLSVPGWISGWYIQSPKVNNSDTSRGPCIR